MGTSPNRRRRLPSPGVLAAKMLLISVILCGVPEGQSQDFPPLPSPSAAASLRDSEVRPASWADSTEANNQPLSRRTESNSRVAPVAWEGSSHNQSSALRVAEPVSGRSRVQESTAERETTLVRSAPPSASAESSTGKSPTRLQPKSATAEPSHSPRRSTLHTVISLGSSLIVVIGLFLGLAWLYRKSIVRTGNSGLPNTVVQILGKTALAPRQQLVLLRFGSKLVLVSNIHGEARTVSEIVDPLEVDQLTGLCESNRPGSISHSFREILTQGVRT
jgi:flagellar protein FliO/FliZ